MGHAGKQRTVGRAAIVLEAQRIAYSVERAEAGGDEESGGWWGLRSAFAALLWTVGAWEEPHAPGIDTTLDDAAEAAVAEHKFQALLEQYAAEYPERETAEQG